MRYFSTNILGLFEASKNLFTTSEKRSNRSAPSVSFASARSTTSLRSKLDNAIKLNSICHHPGGAPLWLLRKEMIRAVADCPDPQRHEVKNAVCRARNGADLWLLRSLVFQFVAIEHGQIEAQSRLNEMQPFFEEWEPQKQ